MPGQQWKAPVQDRPASKVLRNAGYDGYGYRGAHGQSIEMAIDYYACYAASSGFGKVATSASAAACPNSAQYYGKVVNGVEPLVLLGAYRFQGDTTLTGLEQDARSAATAGPFSLEAILFRRWRD